MEDNSPPVAVDDSYTVHGQLLITPTSNDSDPDMTVLVFTQLAHLNTERYFTTMEVLTPTERLTVM